MSAVFAVEQTSFSVVDGEGFSFPLSYKETSPVEHGSFCEPASFCPLISTPFIATEKQFGRFMFCKLILLHFHCKCGIKNTAILRNLIHV